MSDYLSTENKKYSNRLAREKSPYLLQHAHNPVDWFPWGEEAFLKAKKEDKPIFLSIGYSTCHWCHVMEHESFKDEETSRILNEFFVPIKVDREERPDIDHIYMLAVSSMTGQGGWPLNAFLTTDLKPFYGGTYFPPEARWGQPAFRDVLKAIHDAWLNRREQIIESSASLIQNLQERLSAKRQEETLNPDILGRAFQQFHGQFDERYGGFGDQPKFPTGHNLMFLLRYWHRELEDNALMMVDKTLRHMARGGIYDQLGGGFHRYSTDSQWQIPHFEKMLYDQAILARSYLEAYQATHNEEYRRMVEEISDYVLRDLRDPRGGFYSAEDADSLEEKKRETNEVSSIVHRPSSLVKKEGAFYLWRFTEMETILEKDALVFNYYFGIEKEGNAQFDPHGEFVGKNVLYIVHTLEETAQKFNMPVEEVKSLIKRSKEKLLNAREKRPRPHLDDKILVDWNGLMIGALAIAGRVLNDDRYKKAAVSAAEFILNNLVNNEGRLLHRYRDGESAIQGTIGDYAFFIHGLLELYEATFEVRFLEEALKFADKMLKLFWDEKEGGFFMTESTGPDLILRPKEIYDGAIPSGNSIASLDLIRLYYLTMDKRWLDKVESNFAVFAHEISRVPSAYAQMLIAYDFFVGPVKEIVIVPGSKEDNGTVLNMIQHVYARFLPNKAVIVKPFDPISNEKLVKLIPTIKDQGSVEGKTSVYICQNHVCQRPIIREEELDVLLNE